MDNIVKTALDTMSNVKKPQKTFIALLLYALVVVQGKANFRNMSRYYKARFQVEFIFREAKQYTGLMDCQSCRKESIHTQINASFAALNALKLEDLEEKITDDETVISIATWKRRKFNQHLMCRVYEKLGLSLSNEKVMDTYQQLSGYGAIAA